MKKKITLSIDSDVYDELNELPRKVSISEVVNWVLKAMLQDIKKGRELTAEELAEYVRQTPEGKNFLERYQEAYGTKIDTIMSEIRRIKKAIGLDTKRMTEVKKGH